MVKRFLSIMAVLLFVALAAPSAWSALADLGTPIDPHGYPVWYEDAAGLQLELCVPPPAGNASRPDLCIGDPLELDENGDPINPLVLTGESFWWLAETAIDVPGGKAQLTLAVEATFGGAEAPIDGQQISFGRTRIRIDTPVAGTYTVNHPYGTQIFEVADPEEGINYTADIGAANFLFPALGFQGTLAAFGPDEVPFLTWPDYQNNPSLQVRGPVDPENPEEPGPLLEQYVGNPNVASTVVGGTNGNVFRVDGPAGSNLGGVGIDFVETDQFFVMGKVYDTTVPLVAHVFPGVPEQNLFAVGPVNRVDPFNPASTAEVTGEEFDYAFGYPLWYQEKLPVIDPETGEQAIDPLTQLPLFEGGLQLTLCTPGDAMCISDPIDPNDPNQLDFRTGGESFWWSADAVIDDLPAGRAILVLGLEGTFGGDESITDGGQVSFGRVRVRVDTDRAGTYRITHPYGVLLFEDVPVDDNGINYTADIGIFDSSDPDLGFAGTLYSDIGPTVLKWTTFVDPATLEPEAVYPEPLLVTPNAANPELNNYHVGNPGVEHEVTGSPFGTNFFRVEYLNDGDWEVVAESDLFAVSGKLYDPATFEFSINPDAPVAVNDAATLSIATATSATVNVTANDTFAEGALVDITVLPAGETFGPENGTAVANDAAGTVTYTPSAAFAASGGVDTFGYNIVDSTGLTSNNAIVTITVVPVETITVNRSQFRTRNLSINLRGTSNVPGSTLTIHAGTAEGALIGTALVDDRGRWSFRGTSTTNITEVTLVSDSPDATTVTQPLDVR
ncbi:Ig-like domain-containing protein [Desulfuromonas sp. TF]|uniref:Ig-like domain-containing protein n=1 Tax=Desulfuromonas sp. TF TaxID=1232410 RepID=UPI0012DFCD8A|nr:Ig-like domain-containing protein [Desulfuromonas sp. TF]